MNKRVLTYTPLRLLGDSVDIESVLSNKRLLKEPIYSKQFQNLKIGDREFRYLIWIVLFLNSIALLDIVKITIDRESLAKQKVDFIETNALPQTSFQIKSMQEELLSIDKIQSDLRADIYYMSGFKLNKTEYFKRLDFSKNRLNYSIKLDNKKREDEFKNYLSKKEKSTIKVGL